MEVIDRRISFNAGEISPWLDPRIDLEKYHAGCRQLENLRASIYGGAIRRAGTVYLGEALTAATAVRLIPFLGGNGTDYILEFSDEMIRVWDTDTAALVAGVEIDSVYLSGDLNAIQYVQQNDVMYLAHPDYAPQVLLRQAADNWICGPARFDWPVTLGPNTTRISILPWANAYVDAWDSGAAYVIGNHVLSGGIVYRNKLASTNHVPPNATYWDVTTWSNGKVYVVDTVILYGGQYYVAKSAHTAATGSEPGTTAGETYYAKANRIDAIGQGSPSAYVAGTVYQAGVLVTYNSAYFVRTSWLIGQNGIAPTGHIYSLQAWEQVNVTPTGITASIPKGEAITLEASESLFEAGHVGTTWVIAHRRPEAREFMVVNGTLSPVGTTSQPLYVLGAWTASTSMKTADDASTVIHIQRSTDLVNWEFYAVITSLPNANNQILTGTEDEPAFLRLRIASKTGAYDPANDLTVDLVADNGTQYGLAEITAVASATVATATVVLPLYSYDRTTRWEEPAFTSVRGFPRAVAFHNGRLWFGGITARPTSVWGSTVDAYWDFRTGSDDDRALAYTVASDESSTIEWLVSQDMLCIGTTSGEWTLGQRPGDDEIRLRRNTSFGSAPIQGRAIGDALVYVQKSRRKVREFAFNFERDGFLSNDLNQLAEHLGDAEMLQLALQRNPESIVWVVTSRGDLLLLTYERTQNVAGWCRFTTAGSFESVAIVPGDQEEDHVWVCAVRTIDGATVRYIERIAPDMIRALKDGEAAELVFSDCAKIVSAGEAADVDVQVTGTLTDGTNDVSFPTLEYTADEIAFPAVTNTGGYVADGGNYKLVQYTGASAAASKIYGNVFYTAAATGLGGNLISVVHVVGVSGINVGVTGNAITVTAALGSTGAAVIAAVNAHAPAAALVTASAGIGSTASAIAYGSIFFLSGGIATDNWHLSIGDTTIWLADSTEAHPWDIDPADWSAVSPATGTPVISPASETVTGLDHLEGEEVVILADGASHPPRTVAGGEITLEYSVRTAVVGLAYDAIIEPTYLESRNVAEFSKVGKKRIHSLTAEFWKTAGVEISADGGTTWTPMETRTPLDLMDSNRSLFTGLREEKLDGRTERQASIILRATDPLPLAVLSMNIRYQLNTTT